jgi:AMP phosphorylase
VLEAREALQALMRQNVAPDLIDKSVHIAGMILNMCGKTKGNGKEVATDVLKSGKAEKKLREIIFEQGGDAEVKPEDMELGKYGLDIKSEKKGYVWWVDNSAVVSVARAAGSPRDKTAGMQLYKKVGDQVKVGERLFTIYADKARKLKRAEEVLKEETVMDVSERADMVIHEVKELPVHKKSFILER